MSFSFFWDRVCQFSWYPAPELFCEISTSFCTLMTCMAPWNWNIFSQTSKWPVHNECFMRMLYVQVLYSYRMWGSHSGSYLENHQRELCLPPAFTLVSCMAYCSTLKMMKNRMIFNELQKIVFSSVLCTLMRLLHKIIYSNLIHLQQLCERTASGCSIGKMRSFHPGGIGSSFQTGQYSAPSGNEPYIYWYLHMVDMQQCILLELLEEICYFLDVSCNIASYPLLEYELWSEVVVFFSLEQNDCSL